MPAPVRSSKVTWQRVAGICAVWAVATAVVLLVASETRFGPILVNLTRRHGVHVGDVVALIVTYASAAVLTWRLLRTARGTPGESATVRRSSVRADPGSTPGSSN